MSTDDLPLITKSRLVKDFIDLGVRPGGIIMLHASVKAVGWVVGGPDVILHALQEAIGPEGTLMMYVGWEANPYDLESWPEERRRAYLEECPPFDPTTSRANRKWSILTEYLRTTPGAPRSANPEKSLAAIGAEAAWLIEGHPLNYGFGPGSPLERLCRAGGEVVPLRRPGLDRLRRGLDGKGVRMSVPEFGDGDQRSPSSTLRFRASTSSLCSATNQSSSRAR
jgi:aminoglycoside 3-N-acetyltransferase